MLLLCPKCGYPHMPFEVNCHRCMRPLQDESEAAPARANFETKPEPIRLDLQNIVADARKQYDEHSERLRRERLVHAFGGALWVVIATRAMMPIMPLFIPVDAAIGAAAALWTNHRRAGRYEALLTFLVSMGPAFLARTLVGSFSESVTIGFAISAGIAGMGGYLLALRTEFRTDEV